VGRIEEAEKLRSEEAEKRKREEEITMTEIPNK
jgi:hypothetical protein